jgi:hypothetical protein
MSLHTIETEKSLPADDDTLQQFFNRPLFLSLTIGVPFCIFKILFGISAVRTGSDSSVFLSIGGWLIVSWALVDLAMNIGREIYDLLNREAPFEYCTIAQIGHAIQMPHIFLALDTLLTFVIISTMLWSGWIVRLGSAEKTLWNIATTLNLISLSFVVLYNEIRALSQRTGLKR